MFCRLCCSSNSSVEYLQIFDKKGIEMQISQIISQHFWFAPSQDDLFSKIICTSCWYKLDTFHQFYLSIVMAQTHLTKLPVKTDENDIQDSKNDEWILEISSDLLKATNIKEEHDFVSEKGKESDEDFEPDGIDFDNSDDDDCYEPKIKTKKISIASRQKQKQIIKKDPNNDCIEKTKFHAYQKRMEEEDAEITKYIKFDCDVCRIHCKTFSILKQHMRHEHRRSGFVRCCKKKIYKRCLLLDHYKFHLNPETFKCVHCNRNFADSVCLMNHFVVKHRDLDNSNMIKCDYCIKKFPTQELYEEHKKTRHKKLICKDCKKIFFIPSSLKYHERRVHEKAYVQVCDICAKVVANKSLLKIHMLEHAGENRPKFQCKVCNAQLKTQRYLTIHMRRHQEALMNIKCDICNKEVPSLHALKSHIKFVHERINSFICNICSKAFNRAITLKEHMTTHTGGRLYACTFCTKTFNSNANMYSHRKKAHPREWLQKKLSIINNEDSN